MGIPGNLTLDETCDYIRAVALCGTSAAVLRRLRQFRLLPENGNGRQEACALPKIELFGSLEEGLRSTLLPA